MRWEDCVKRDLERVGGEWRTTAEDRSRRLLIENIVREKTKKKTMVTMVTMANLTPDDRDVKRRTRIFENKIL